MFKVTHSLESGGAFIVVVDTANEALAKAIEFEQAGRPDVAVTTRNGDFVTPGDLASLCGFSAIGRNSAVQPVSYSES